MDDRAQRPANRLGLEKSPYLLQHAHNPVDWYPWSDEAFEKAHAEDKPIFLSIGYSTCHWCHVMERESFEDEEVAALLNQGFVSIKVDREERPDIDAVYMTVCQMMTGSGGWPMTIMLTPDKKPFFAATYIPKGSRTGQVGLMQLLPRVIDIWENRREEVLANGEKVAQVLSTPPRRAGRRELGPDTLEQARRRLSLRFDPRHGGFSRAPKFPTPHNLTFLLRDWSREGRAESLHMVESTLDAMRRGGVYDQIGFGFHRYSTDSEWLVPHFEKMLYDQAQLVMAYVEAYQATGKASYAATAREVIEYVLRDLSSPEGGFYSAEDADSEGVEGKFYVWTSDELRELLSKEDAERLIRVYGMTDEGNFREEASGDPTGHNIPHLSAPIDEKSEAIGLAPDQLVRWLDEVRSGLLVKRSQRVRPSLDDKVLTDWNGLMIAALAKAASALDEPSYLEAARRAADFLLERLFEEESGVLLHRYRAGEAAVPGFLDDYAFLAWGLLDLYEASFETKYLAEALRLTDELVDHFWDEADGGFFLTSDRAELVLARHKDAYDGATPSGNSVAAVNLVRLARMTGVTRYEELAERTINAFAAVVESAPDGFTHLLQALGLSLGPSYEVVIVGEEEAADTRALIRGLWTSYVPSKVVLFRSASTEAPEVATYSPFIEALGPRDGKATAYVCKGQSCELPTHDVTEMLELVGLAPA